MLPGRLIRVLERRRDVETGLQESRHFGQQIADSNELDVGYRGGPASQAARVNRLSAGSSKSSSTN